MPTFSPQSALEGRVDTVKQYLLRLSLIVVGVLAAMAVNQWVESSIRATVAERLQIDLRNEIESNLSSVKRSRERHERSLSGLQQALKVEHSRLTSKSTHSVANETAEQSIDIRTGRLLSSSWETAVATGATSVLPAPAARSWASAYSTQRAIDGILQQHKAATLAAMSRLAMDPKLLEGPHRLMRLETLLYLEAYVGTAIGNYRSLEEELEKVLMENPATSKLAPSPARK